MSNWNWKVVRQFLKQSFDLGLSRSSCLNYLHRLGFVLKRPKKRLLKAKDEERKAFIIQYCSASTTFAGSVNYSCRFTSRS